MPVVVGAEARLRQQPVSVSHVDVLVGIVQTAVVVADHHVHGVHPGTSIEPVRCGKIHRRPPIGDVAVGVSSFNWTRTLFPSNFAGTPAERFRLGQNRDHVLDRARADRAVAWRRTESVMS